MTRAAQVTFEREGFQLVSSDGAGVLVYNGDEPVYVDGYDMEVMSLPPLPVAHNLFPPSRPDPCLLMSVRPPPANVGCTAAGQSGEKHGVTAPREKGETVRYQGG